MEGRWFNNSWGMGVACMCHRYGGFGEGNDGGGSWYGCGIDQEVLVVFLGMPEHLPSPMWGYL